MTCSECGTTGNYAVGTILLDLGLAHLPFDETVSFTACFRCKGCNSIGPWQIPTLTKTTILLHSVAAIPGEGTGPVVHGRSQLFDGTIARSGEQAVAHLRGLIAKDQGNAFLWSRLGNTFRIANEPEEAKKSYLKALEIDESDIESAHSCAQILDETGSPAPEVAGFYHRVIQHAWKKKDSVPDQLLRACVRTALESLFELHSASDGEIDIFPKPSLDSAGMPAETAVVELRSFDLSNEDSWGEFVAEILREPRPGIGRRQRRRRISNQRSRGLHRNKSRRSVPTRNGPCPCGSGRKYKNCCAA